jgi:NADH-quinone oxidoreductase subunit E
MSALLNGENNKKYQKLKKQYPKKQSLILPLLWMFQYQHGYVSQEAMVFISKEVDNSPAFVMSVMSFYTMFSFKPRGKYHIELCKTLSCSLCGAKDIKEYLENKLNINKGETTKDNLFTYEEVECLGNCDMAPIVAINGEYHTNMDTNKMESFISKAKK